jgi:putative membrane protein insertion efficiency factor
VKTFFIFLVQLQRGWAPVWRSWLGSSGPCCRFHPTCSEYAEEAIREHGAGRGLFLSLGRVLRCQPWGGAGWDPVKGAQ